MKRPVPLDSPRDFRINEMFFSTTEKKGVILSGNDVFVRVSGYAREELVGQPHNLIRHPDMPRAVFRLVWGHLQRGLPVAGYVKNLAKDGRYYWVVALLMPIEGGYLSVRFMPSSPLLPVVEGVYREMVACEREQTAQGADGKTAMIAAEKLLLERLKARGFDSYNAFMRTLLHEELKSRDANLTRGQLRLFPMVLEANEGVGDAQAASLRLIYASGGRAYEQINTLYVQLDDFAALNEKLAKKSALVLEMTKEFRLIAFNAALRSSRIGEDGHSLAVISDYLSTASARTTGIVTKLAEHIGAISAKLRAVIFNLAAARLQIEMVMSFCAELALKEAEADLATAEQAAQLRQRMIEDLQRSFAETIERAVGALVELEKDLGELGSNAEEMSRMVLTLQVAQVGGLVEASRLKDDDSFTVMFADLRQGVETTKREMAELDAASERLAALANETPRIAGIISAAVNEMRGAVHALSTATLTTASVGKPAAASALLVKAGTPEPTEAETANV